MNTLWLLLSYVAIGVNGAYSASNYDQGNYALLAVNLSGLAAGVGILYSVLRGGRNV